MTRPDRCSRCFKDSTRVAYGKWLNGRPVEEPVCDDHAPTPEDIGTVRLFDTWQHTRHPAREYRVAGVRRLLAEPCSRYFGSDGTLCATHHGRFLSDTTARCDASGAVVAVTA